MKKSFLDWNLIYERSERPSEGAAELAYFWGPDLSGTLQGAGGVGTLVAVSIAGQFYFPGYDNNGNVIGYWDENGSLVAEYAYDAFGNTISSSGSMASVFPHRFSTKYYDAETDLYYYGYRYYSPSLGRWISRDPIEEDDCLNLYLCLRNNSVSDWDYLGQRIGIRRTTTNNRVDISISVTMQIVLPKPCTRAADFAKRVRNRIKRRWSQTVTTNGVTYSITFSKFDVVAFEHDRKDLWRPDYHTFNLVDKASGFSRDAKLWEVSHVETIGGSYSEIFRERFDHFETYVHEFGHMLGLKDLYVEQPRQDIHTGRMIRGTVPNKRFTNHIMSDGGEKVSPEEMRMLGDPWLAPYNKGLPVMWR